MPTLNINGRKVTVDDSFLQLSPEDQEKTVDEIASHLDASPKQDAAVQVEQPTEDDDSQKSLRSELSAMTQNPAKALYDQRPTWQKPIIAAQDIGNIIGDDLTFGFGDKAAAAIRAPFTDKTYEEELAANRQGTQNARDRAGSAAYGADVTAALMLPRLLPAKAGVVANPGTLSKLGRFAGGVVKGGAQGAAVGAAQAAGHDTDIGQGAATGLAFGAAVPAALGIGKTVGGAVLNPVADAVRARVNPSGYAAGKIAERLNSGGLSVERAAKRAADQNISLADAGGDSTRGLLRTTTNIPGPARDTVNARLTMRQFGQGGRLKSAIAQTFADPDGYLAAKDEIADTAKRLASPLFREAEKTPIHFTKELEGIINTPAGRRALAKAEELAANEQVPFKQMFVNIADDGTATFKRVPDQRAWQYIKTALDDMVDAETDSITKKVSNDGRIINNLKNRLLEQLDAQNPVYAQARKVWGGQRSLDDALETGRDVFKLSPDALKRTVAGMTEAQKASARVGAAETLRAQIDAAGVTNNAVLRIFSKPQQIRNLQTLFETPQKFSEFRKAVWAEARKRGTYEAVKNNSTTARQMADMMESGGLQEGFNTAKTALTQGPIAATMQFVGSRLRMLGGLTPQVADNIAKRLMTTSPEVRAQITSELQRIEQARLSSEQKSQAVRALLGRTSAIVGSGALVQSQQ